MEAGRNSYLAGALGEAHHEGVAVVAGSLTVIEILDNDSLGSSVLASEANDHLSGLQRREARNRVGSQNRIKQ